MKIALAILGASIALAAAAPAFEDEYVRDENVLHTKDNWNTPMNDQMYLRKYKAILRLFKYLHQRADFHDDLEIINKWKIEDHIDGFTKPEVVRDFLEYYHKGMLVRDQIFSIYDEDHLKQAIVLFKLFFYAKDFETLYNTAVCARHYLNQGMFLYSFTVALMHRSDTHMMVLPPIYEIYPYYFFNKDIINKVRYSKEMHSMDTHNYRNTFASDYMYLHSDKSMTYFTEDIGINTFFFYYNLYRPFWMDTTEFPVITHNRGEEFYYFYQQLLARYYLERLSNGLGKIDMLTFDDSFFTKNTFMDKSNIHDFLKLYETEIREILNTGYITLKDGRKMDLFKHDGFNMFAELIEGNPDLIDTHFYGYLQELFRYYIKMHADTTTIGKMTDLHETHFWTFVRRMMMYFQMYKSHLTHYTRQELEFTGVKVESLDVSSLITFFEHYDVDMTNVMDINNEELEHNHYNVKTTVERLNHKPFTYKIKVLSEKQTDAVVRVFIGPKYDENGHAININENRMNFVEFDRFKYDLKEGQNMILRNSRDIYFTVDRTPYKQLYREAMLGFSENNLKWNSYNLHYTFPNRFLLPKGKQDGQMYQFFVIVSPYKQHQMMELKSDMTMRDEYFRYPIVGLGVQYLDTYALGYPFDRQVNTEEFIVPNMMFKDVTIYHQPMDETKYRMHENLHDVDTTDKHNVYENLYESKHELNMSPIFKRSVKSKDMDKKHMKMNEDSMYPTMDKKHMMMDKDMMHQTMDKKHMMMDKDFMYPTMDKKHMMMDKDYMYPTMDKKHMMMDKDYMYPTMDKKHMMMDKDYMYQTMDKKHMMDKDMYNKMMMMNKDNMYPTMDQKHMMMDKDYMYPTMDKKHMMMMMNKDNMYPSMDQKHMMMDEDYMYPTMDKKHMMMDKDYMYPTMDKKHMMMDKDYMYQTMDKKHMMDKDMYYKMMMMNKDNMYPTMDQKHMMMDKDYMYPTMDKKNMMMMNKDNMYPSMDQKHMMMMKNKDYMYPTMDKKHMMMMMDKDNMYPIMDQKHMMMDKDYMYQTMDKKHMMDKDMYYKMMMMNKDNMYPTMDQKHMMMDKDYMYPTMDKKNMMMMNKDNMYPSMDQKHMMMMNKDYMYPTMDQKHMMMDKKHMMMDKDYMYPTMDKKQMMMDKDYMYQTMDKKHMMMDKDFMYPTMDKKHMMDKDMYYKMNNMDMSMKYRDMDYPMHMDKDMHMMNKGMTLEKNMDMQYPMYMNMDKKYMDDNMHMMNMERMNNMYTNDKYMDMYRKPMMTMDDNKNTMYNTYRNVMLGRPVDFTMRPDMYKMYNMPTMYNRNMDMNMDNKMMTPNMYYRMPYMMDNTKMNMQDMHL